MRGPILAGGIALLGGLVIFGLHAESGSTVAKDEQEIRHLIAMHASAAQQGDLRGLVSVYHTDADVRYSDGTILRGRAELEKSYSQALSNDPKGLAHSHPVDSIHIRFLRPDVAFVDVESVSGGGTDQAGAAGEVSRTPLFVVFTKEEGKWGVAVQRSGVRLK